jgi:exodeoxyribonuclease III
MRIVTWNANSSPGTRLPASLQRAFERKRDRVLELQPDIVVLQELARPADPVSPHHVWQGRFESRGVAVVATSDYVLELIGSLDYSQSVFPIRVRGPHNFTLVAVWALPGHASPRAGNYVAEVLQGLMHYRHLLDGPVVVTGDFNSNARWDAQARPQNHSDLVAFLEEELGLVSAYHCWNMVPQGREEDATFYLYRNREKPYHIDFVFVPADWCIEHVHAGSHDHWCRESDHTPLVVDVTPPL